MRKGIQVKRIRMYMGALNGNDLRDLIINNAKSNSEALAFFVGNTSKMGQDSTKAGLVVDSGAQIGAGAYKAATDFVRGDTICGGLCCVSISCEVASSILVWCPIPGKITTISILKGTSIGCQRFRDFCATGSPLSLC